MQEMFSNTVQKGDFLCRHARGISERSGKEFHRFHEILYYLDGNAEFISEELHMSLKPETLIFIPRESYHQLVIHGDPRGYYRCLIQFPEEVLPEGLPLEHPKIRAWTADEELRYLMGKAMAVCDAGASTPVTEAVLTLLLDALAGKKDLTDKAGHQSELIRRATEYINRNINRRILLEEVAAECNVSLSTLCHSFKKEMNIPIHKFIVKKRLVNAGHRIASGQSATAAALDCGFRDYSGYYKQYKKLLGVSPSERGMEYKTPEKRAQ